MNQLSSALRRGAVFAVSSIRTWLVTIGRTRHPGMRETALTTKARHYPPGTSKWNKIEHRLFRRITQNWRGRPLTEHAAIIDLIAATTTKTGLKVEAVLDTAVSEKGVKIPDAR